MALWSYTLSLWGGGVGGSAEMNIYVLTMGFVPEINYLVSCILYISYNNNNLIL